MTIDQKRYNISRLRDHRVARGITQTHIAKLLGYKSTSGYSNIESGKVDLSIQTAFKICEILQVDFETLYFDEE